MSFLSRRHSREAADDATFKPQLTSLVDVMTILLVFLIKSFSVEGSLDTPAKDLELPVSIAIKNPEPRFAFAVTENAISFESEIIAKTSEFKDAKDLMIQPLADWIDRKEKEMNVTEGVVEVTIFADKDLEFNVLKRVMYTCSMAGIKDYSVMVISEGRNE